MTRHPRQREILQRLHQLVALLLIKRQRLEADGVDQRMQTAFLPSKRLSTSDKLTAHPVTARRFTHPQIVDAEPIAFALANQTAAHHILLVAQINANIAPPRGINKLAVVRPQPGEQFLFVFLRNNFFNNKWHIYSLFLLADLINFTKNAFFLHSFLHNVKKKKSVLENAFHQTLTTYNERKMRTIILTINSYGNMHDQQAGSPAKSPPGRDHRRCPPLLSQQRFSRCQHVANCRRSEAERWPNLPLFQQ